ncbi:MAG: M48 family metalloprotease [Bryobacteraceae bacterium]|jgi:predicted Zn-dependent protease
MRSRHVSIGCAAFLTVLAQVAGCQAPSSAAPTQAAKEWEPGPRTAQELEQRDGKIDNPIVIRYLQRLENRIASATGAPPAEIRLTRSPDLYVSLPDTRVLYISAGLLQRIESEAELAGLLAHELAHAQAATAEGQGTGILREGCVLQSKLAPAGNQNAREREMQATTAATGYLKAAGYDPAGVLDLFSKLAYEHPDWAKAIVPEDLLALRAKTEAEAMPPGGYRIGSSDFEQAHAILVTVLSRSR